MVQQYFTPQLPLTPFQLLQCSQRIAIRRFPLRETFGEVAQSVRACGSYPQCRGFNSLPRYQLQFKPLRKQGLFCFQWVTEPTSTQDPNIVTQNCSQKASLAKRQGGAAMPRKRMLRSAASHLCLNAGRYWFRQRVPIKLQPILGQREIYQTLRTGDLRLARKKGPSRGPSGCYDIQPRKARRLEQTYD